MCYQLLTRKLCGPHHFWLFDKIEAIMVQRLQLGFSAELGNVINVIHVALVLNSQKKQSGHDHKEKLRPNMM